MDYKYSVIQIKLCQHRERSPNKWNKTEAHLYGDSVNAITTKKEKMVKNSPYNK